MSNTLEPQNPRKWRYTYETQSHIPILKLFIFNPQINPITHCTDLEFDLQFEKSLLIASWIEQGTRISLPVPLPRVLVDLESPVRFRVGEDHVEVRIGLLLPVDHPIASSFVSELVDCDGRKGEEIACGGWGNVDSDAKRLSCDAEVHFYCRSCSFQLSRGPVRSFLELPSANWTEAADNWFGSCCCSFGGVSEKLVSDYVKSYRCVEGTCLVSSSTVIPCKDDLIGCQFGGVDSCDELHGDCKLSESAVVLGKCHANGNGGFPLPPDDVKSLSLQCKDDKDVCEGHKEDEPENESSCCPDVTNDVDRGKSCCSTSGSDITVDLMADQKSFLNGYLGDIFIFKTPALSKEIKWVDFACPNCSSLLGAYPCVNGSEPLDGGIRLLKSYISTSLPASSARDIFRKYSVEKMFADHLMESAKEELSFRTVVRDMKSRSNMMEIVLVNPNSWCCSGYCSEGTAEWLPRMNLDPVIKVMFFGICDNAKTNSRHGGERGSKEPADEVFMLRHPGLELIKCLDANKNMFPPSFSSSSGLLTSCIQR
ncbi:hypothetical protein Droror1_Dr00009188 [Drosera rotundifolia]